MSNYELWSQEKEIFKKEMSFTLFKIGAIKIGKFKLTSGKESPYYMDLRILPSYPKIFDRVTDLYVRCFEEEIKGEEINRIVGIPTAGIPLATLISQKMDMPMVYYRGKRKEHGTGKIVEGEIEEGDHVVLIDDVITTGKSILNCFFDLKELGVLVEGILCLLDREEWDKNFFRENGIKVIEIIKSKELFRMLGEMNLLKKEELEKIYDYMSAQSFR